MTIRNINGLSNKELARYAKYAGYFVEASLLMGHTENARIAARDAARMALRKLERDEMRRELCKQETSKGIK